MKNDKGFTLIELVMFIVVGAIFLPASMIAFTSVMNNYSRPDYYIKARFYAEKRMSEITNKLYADVLPASCNSFGEGDGYTTECSVVEVNPDTLSTASGDPYYKRVVVTVRHTGLIGGEYSIVTLVAKRPRKP
jgi:Tfp pilus assembly protein PilE